MMKARVETKNPYLVMMGLYLGAFVGMFSETSLNIALPQLMSVFQVSAAYAQWMVVGYMLVIGLVLPFASLLMKWCADECLCQFFCVAIGRAYDPRHWNGVGVANDVCVGIGSVPAA